MRSHVSPGVDEVFGAQCRVGSQKLIFAHAQTARLFQHPDGNTRANDARLATANSRGRIDSGRRIVQVLRDEAQQLRLLGTAEGWKQFLDLAQSTHTSSYFTRFYGGSAEGAGSLYYNSRGFYSLFCTRARGGNGGDHPALRGVRIAERRCGGGQPVRGTGCGHGGAFCQGQDLSGRQVRAPAGGGDATAGTPQERASAGAGTLRYGVAHRDAAQHAVPPTGRPVVGAGRAGYEGGHRVLPVRRAGAARAGYRGGFQSAAAT